MSNSQAGEAKALAAGTFCWADLGTTDAASAKNFYSQLFGWSIFEPPDTHGSMPYSIFQIDGHDVVAAYPLCDEMRAKGIPPHWLAYVLVENVEESAARAWELGGKVDMEPIDVEGHGRMALITDPTGAMVALWQPLKHTGSGHLNQVGGMCWHELATRDHERAREFYCALFGWGAQTADVGRTIYTTFTRADGTPAGGMLQMNEQWGEIPAHWTIYFSVADCDATAARARELGGEVCVEPTDLPPIGRFAVIRDAEGASFSIIKLWS